MLNGLKKFASAVIAVTVAFTFVGAFTRLTEETVSADTTAAATTSLDPLKITGKVRMQTYGYKKGSYSSADGVLTLGKKGKKKRIENMTLSFKNTTGYEGT